jgi:hypothetical protein
MEATIENGVLIIKAKLTAEKDAPTSSTGKSKMLAGTGGFAPVDGNGRIKYSLNVIAPLK